MKDECLPFTKYKVRVRCFVGNINMLLLYWVGSKITSIFEFRGLGEYGCQIFFFNYVGIHTSEV